ncbi:UTP--glucose-1-phosphate uridylyltransferase [candidate division KSB1 bacterium]|nr:UTP--glucose-1-phosphate uridylyltransferase [candidate division KSB1 bacterium]
MKVRKAIIPAAGLGTRLFPVTKVVKKEFFPIVDKSGLVKPVIQLNVEEALNAGIEEIAIIIQPDDEPLFKSYFGELPGALAERYEKDELNKKSAIHLKEMGKRITYIPQVQQEGFGHAVYCAKEWANGEPVLLMLGDHLFRSNLEINCSKQLINIFEKYGATVSGVARTLASQLRYFGTVTGEWLNGFNEVFRVKQLHEKPSIDYAREHLRMPGLPADTYFCFFGMHVFSNAIFDMLEYQITHNLREKGEFQLTSAQERLRQQEPNYYGLEVNGERFDIGVPPEFKKTIANFA